MGNLTRVFWVARLAAAGAVVLLVAGSALAGPNDPATGPALTRQPPGTIAPLQPPVNVGVGTTTGCGKPMTWKVHLTRTTSSIQIFSGKIAFNPAGATPVVVPFSLQAGPTGTWMSVDVPHPQVLDCSQPLPDATLAVWTTGTNPYFKKDYIPSGFFGDKLPGTPATPGPYVAKFHLEGTCGGTGGGWAHIERVGSGTGQATVSLTFAGATKQTTTNVPSNPSPAADPKISAPGPIDCKAASGLPTFQTSIAETGVANTWGPSFYHAFFKAP